MTVYADHTSMLQCAELHNVHVAKQLKMSSLCTRPLQPQGCQTSRVFSRSSAGHSAHSSAWTRMQQQPPAVAVDCSPCVCARARADSASGKLPAVAMILSTPTTTKVCQRTAANEIRVNLNSMRDEYHLLTMLYPAHVSSLVCGTHCPYTVLQTCHL